MAFGYQYWLIYWPQVNADSFLLFTHRPDGATQLRDYSSKREVKCGQPAAGDVYGGTQVGKTRFGRSPHRTTDTEYWFQETMAINRSILSKDISRSEFQGPEEKRPWLDQLGEMLCLLALVAITLAGMKGRPSRRSLRSQMGMKRRTHSRWGEPHE